MAEPKKKSPPCPICRKPAQPAFRPFCSLRCSEIDLGRWFTESYVVPGSSPGRDGISDDDDDLTG